MADEKKVEPAKAIEVMEDEFKLIKGELKETLSSVRDYLLNSELPASEYAAILQALGGGVTSQSSIAGKLSIDKDAFSPEPPSLPAEEPLNESEGPEGSGGAGSGGSEGTEYIEEDEPVDLDEPALAEPEMAEETVTEELPPEAVEEAYSPGHGVTEPTGEYWPATEEANQSTPKVNLLANLTHWVANAKRELGSEQLPAFLEVYGISGHLSPELKEIIIHLADITSENSQEASMAETWSKLMLELHGILTGGDAPLHPVRPYWGQEETETEEPEIEEKPKEKPMKLKLVLSNGEENKEFSLNLDPADD